MSEEQIEQQLYFATKEIFLSVNYKKNTLFNAQVHKLYICINLYKPLYKVKRANFALPFFNMHILEEINET